jgi:hypothetical protein
MNTPSPRPAAPTQRAAIDDAQMRRWLKLRRELAQLHARLEYLKLMASLGVHR